VDHVPALQHDVGFFTGVLLLVVVSALVFNRAGSAFSSPAQTGNRVVSASPVPTIPTTLSASARMAQVRAYTASAPDAGLMQPAVDAQGNLWVGEMNTNRLTRIDSHTGQVTSWTPPGADHNIMVARADAQGDIWFSEQAANYIGRFDPATQRFTTYPLPRDNGRPMGPQELRFDASGKLWITLTAGGRIGRLDPASGALQTWPVPAPAAGVESMPYALAITPSGQIWFGMLSGGAVGRLDPETGHVTLLRLADPKALIFAMDSDATGHIWFSELQAGTLGVIDTATNTVRELPVPQLLGDPQGLYGVAVAPSGDVWCASSGANALVRFAPQAGAFTFFQLPVAGSVPYGVTLDAAGKVWFSADAASGNYVGVMAPQG
jgi:virginiamycin B lyase